MRILFAVHNHPDQQPGGSEAFALNLYRTLTERHGAAGLFLAGCLSSLRAPKPGTLLQSANDRPDEMLVALDSFDRFYLSQRDIYGLASLRPMIARLDPEVVHLHHPLLWGVEGIDLFRRAAPRARMVATLHDFFPICAREGQLLTADDRLCPGPTLERCTSCFPERNRLDFALRGLALRDAFRAFDLLLAPSAFLRDRFVAAGWDAERIEVVPNAVPAAPAAPHRPTAGGRRDRFAVFGNVSRFKGTLTALRASALLSAEGVDHRLAVHGGTAWQSEAFLADFAAALAAAPAATHHGRYDPATHAALIAQADWVVVPSIWYENAPLVILEAFRHRRPVICGNTGGMAELVRDGVDGLHSPQGDPDALATVMRRAAETPGLWQQLVDGIVQPPDLDAAARRHIGIYRGDATGSTGRMGLQRAAAG